MSRDTGAKGQIWKNLRNKITEVILIYNQKYKIDIHDFILVQMIE